MNIEKAGQQIELTRWIPQASSSVGPPSLERLFTWEQARRVLQKNLKPTLAVLATIILLVVAASLLMKNVYQPIARVQIDPPGSGIKTLHEIEYASETDNQDYLETQAQILKSDALAIAVIRALHLDRNPELVPAAAVEKYGAAEPASTLPKAYSDDPYMREQYALADRTPLESIAP